MALKVPDKIYDDEPDLKDSSQDTVPTVVVTPPKEETFSQGVHLRTTVGLETGQGSLQSETREEWAPEDENLLQKAQETVKATNVEVAKLNVEILNFKLNEQTKGKESNTESTVTDLLGKKIEGVLRRVGVAINSLNIKPDRRNNHIVLEAIVASDVRFFKKIENIKAVVTVVLNNTEDGVGLMEEYVEKLDMLFPGKKRKSLDRALEEEGTAFSEKLKTYIEQQKGSRVSKIEIKNGELVATTVREKPPIDTPQASETKIREKEELEKKLEEIKQTISELIAKKENSKEMVSAAPISLAEKADEKTVAIKEEKPEPVEIKKEETKLELTEAIEIIPGIAVGTEIIYKGKIMGGKCTVVELPNVQNDNRYVIKPMKNEEDRLVSDWIGIATFKLTKEQLEKLLEEGTITIADKKGKKIEINKENMPLLISGILAKVHNMPAEEFESLEKSKQILEVGDTKSREVVQALLSDLEEARYSREARYRLVSVIEEFQDWVGNPHSDRLCNLAKNCLSIFTYLMDIKLKEKIAIETPIPEEHQKYIPKKE